MSLDPRLAPLKSLLSEIKNILASDDPQLIDLTPDETYVATASQAGVMLKQNINGWASFIFTFSATAGSHSVLIEGNETGLDSDQWYALSGTPVDLASAGMVATRPVTTGYSAYVYAKRFPWIRIRVSAYGGGGATITARITLSKNPVSSATYVTTITGMANNNNAATNGGPSPYHVMVGGITRPTNDITDVSGVSTPINFSPGGQLVIRPYSSAGADWTYAAAAGGVVSSTSAVTMKAAVAGKRNEVTWISIANDTLSGATELEVRSGSTVLFREKLPTTASRANLIEFPTPLRGGVNEAITVQLATSVTGGVFVNAGGCVSA